MPPNEYMAFGSMMHTYAEKMANFLKNIQDHNIEVVKEDIEMAKIFALDGQEVDRRVNKYLDNLVMFFSRCLINYGYYIFSVEEYIHDVDRNLSGLADIVFMNEDNDLIVVDYKTSKAQSIKKYRLELCYYKALLEYRYSDMKVVTAGIYFIKDNGYRFLNFTNEQVKGTSISIEDYNAALELLDYIRDEVDKGVFIPSRQYTCQFCCYKELCERDGNF